METNAKNTGIRKVLIVVLVFNWLVAFLKLIFGYIVNSSSMSADGFHSLSDGASNIIGLVGIAIASMPRDEDHQYGHKKYETFTAIIIALLLFLLSYNIIASNISRLKAPVVPNVDFNSFAVMIFTIAVNIIVMAYEYKMGKRFKSDILIADSMHTRADILTSFSVIAALIAVKLGKPILDPVCSLVIGVFIAYAGVIILRDSSRVLCDQAALGVNNVEDIVCSIDGVLECHNIRTRGREDDIFIDLHILVRPNMHISKADKICDEIERQIKARIPGVVDVVVHAEPKSA